MAWAASSPPGQPAGHLVHDVADAGKHLVHRQPVADQPGGADGHLDGAGLGSPVRQRGGDRLGGGVGVLKAARSGAGVGAAGIQDHRAQLPGGEHLLGPQHRRSFDLVAGEHPGGRVVGPFVENQREVQRSRRLDAGGDAGGPESGRCGDALRADQPRLVARRSRRHSDHRKAFRLRPSQRQVHRLHRGAGRCP